MLFRSGDSQQQFLSIVRNWASVNLRKTIATERKARYNNHLERVFQIGMNYARIQVDFGVQADWRSTCRDCPTAGSSAGGCTLPNAPRSHRYGQDVHHRQCGGTNPAPNARAGAQQDACRSALRRIQGTLPAECCGILRQLLRLLSTRSLRPALRSIHREANADQRAD